MTEGAAHWARTARAMTALDKYQGMVNVLDAKGEDRPFVLLARRQIAAITENKSASADALKSRLTAAGVGVTGIGPVQPSLEDVFLEVAEQAGRA